jgi:ribose/xylose/arabinose/galactoside ABC-type transport system permease subunit
MIVALLFIFILLQIADSLTTVHILKNGGREANPFLNWAFQKLGMGATLAIIKVAAVLLVFVAWNEWLTLGLNVFYIGVVGWNSYQIFKS